MHGFRGVIGVLCLLAVCVPCVLSQSLSALAVEGCPTLSPAFTGTNRAYTCDIAPTLSADPTIRITATPASDSLVSFRGSPSRGSASAISETYTIAVGIRDITVAVAKKGVASAFIVTITFKRPAFNPLSSLSVTGAITPPTASSFSTSYAVNVNYPTTSTSIAATCEKAGDTLTVQGAPIASSYDLNVGANTYAIVCTSADGSATAHALTVTRNELPWLSELKVALTATGRPIYTKKPNTQYTLNVFSGATAVVVVVRPPYPMAINGTPATGQVTVPLSTTSLSTVITLDVGDATTGITTYTVTVVKAASNNLAQTDVQSALVPSLK